MEELILIIDNISRYGLYSNITIENKEQDLERNLVYLYIKYFEIDSITDSTIDSSYKKNNNVNFRENISSNFPEFGWYHTVVNRHQILEKANLVTGDAVDDLADIILDLLEVKWRYKHGSLEDAACFFKFIFQVHTQQHLLGLLTFLKSKHN